MQKKWEYNGAVHLPFTDFKKSYTDSYNSSGQVGYVNQAVCEWKLQHSPHKLALLSNMDRNMQKTQQRSATVV